MFDEILTPFVYRRYLDYGVFDALRTMKRLISQEVARKEMESNIKLGPGGIREIEFIAQVFQLIRGGRVPALQNASPARGAAACSRSTAQIAAERGRAPERGVSLSAHASRTGCSAWTTGRRTSCRATPSCGRGSSHAMGAPDWAALLAAVDAAPRDCRRRSSTASRSRATSPAPRIPSSTRYRDGLGIRRPRRALARACRSRARTSCARLLADFRGGGLYRRMDEISRQRLAAVVARMVPELAAQSAPALALSACCRYLQSICRRSAYLALLDENPMTLKRLLTVAGQSPLLARQIAEHPLLLDELLDTRLFDEPPSRDGARARPRAAARRRRRRRPRGQARRDASSSSAPRSFASRWPIGSAGCRS